MENQTRSAFIAIVGKPNVGKSSIMNYLLGQKVAIVSPRPQTTRTRIMGVLTEDGVQLVFTDTPGMHKPRTKLGDFMVNEISSGLDGVDSCMLVVEEKGELTEAELQLIEEIKKYRMPCLLAINKIDRLKEKELLAERIAYMTGFLDFTAIVPVSAQNGTSMKALKEELFDMAVPGPHPEDTLTDQPERVIAAEIIRESALKLLNEEVPHGIAVDIESIKERDNGMIDIMATIYCEKQSHKGIIIGKQGAMLKKIGTGARHEIEHVFDTRANLNLWVKVREDWRNKDGNLRAFGFVNQDE